MGCFGHMDDLDPQGGHPRYTCTDHDRLSSEHRLVTTSRTLVVVRHQY